jgi:hypothetical protein
MVLPGVRGLVVQWLQRKRSVSEPLLGGTGPGGTGQSGTGPGGPIPAPVATELSPGLSNRPWQTRTGTQSSWEQAVTRASGPGGCSVRCTVMWPGGATARAPRESHTPLGDSGQPQPLAWNFASLLGHHGNAAASSDQVTPGVVRQAAGTGSVDSHVLREQGSPC